MTGEMRAYLHEKTGEKCDDIMKGLTSFFHEPVFPGAARTHAVRAWRSGKPESAAIMGKTGGLPIVPVMLRQKNCGEYDHTGAIKTAGTRFIRGDGL